MPLIGHLLINGMLMYILLRLTTHGFWPKPKMAIMSSVYWDLVVLVVVFVYKRRDHFWDSYYEIWRRLELCGTSDEVQELYYDWEDLRGQAFGLAHKIIDQLDIQFEHVFDEFKRNEKNANEKI